MASMMQDLAREAFANGDYQRALELFELCIREHKTMNWNNINSSLDIYYGYADSLAFSGRLELSFDVYTHICNRLERSVPLDKLQNLSLALLNSVSSSTTTNRRSHHLYNNNYNSVSSAIAAANSDQLNVGSGDSVVAVVDPLCCAICEDILKLPVTAVCGHTFCGECCYDQTQCKICGKKFATFGNSFKQDVLVLRLVEKWWSPEANDRAIIYMQNNALDEALKSCNESLEKCPNNYKGLLLRSEVLYRLNHLKSSLADADNAIKSRPTSYKAHLRRAFALSALGSNDEALLSYCLSACLNDSTSSTISSSTITQDVAKIIQRLFVPSIMRTHHHSSAATTHTITTTVTMTTPYSSAETTQRRRKRKQYIMADDSNNIVDCDKENSSCSEEDCYPQRRKRKLANRKYRSCAPTNADAIRILLNRIALETNKMKRIDPKCHLLKVNPSLVEPSDFECVLCYRTLWKPVVTPCGHTYCLVCLDRCLDYSSHCPLCKSSFGDDYSLNIVRNSLSRKYVTKFIEMAMQRFIPVAYERRKLQEIEKEPFVPVFICTTAFPYVPCPLFVYESRYRLMIRRAIESGQRQFGIAHPYHECERYSDYGTMLDIRDCVQLGDGRAILSTVGCRRFRVVERDEKDGYDTAKVQYIYDEPVPQDRLQSIVKLHANVYSKAIGWYKSLPEHTKEEILKSFGSMPALEQQWATITDGPAWAWYIIAIIPLSQQLKVEILATTNLEKRLRAIDKTLEHLAAQKRRSVPPVAPCEGLQTCQAIECCQQRASSSQTHLDDELQQIT